MTRTERQYRVALWCLKAFGAEHFASVEMRGLRLAEEAIEAAQACRCDKETLHKLIEHVYGKECGLLRQEIAQVGVSLLALANAAGENVDDLAEKELALIMSKPANHYTIRNENKIALGFAPQGDPKDAPK